MCVFLCTWKVSWRSYLIPVIKLLFLHIAVWINCPLFCAILNIMTYDNCFLLWCNFINVSYKNIYVANVVCCVSLENAMSLVFLWIFFSLFRLHHKKAQDGFQLYCVCLFMMRSDTVIINKIIWEIQTILSVHILCWVCWKSKSALKISFSIIYTT